MEAFTIFLLFLLAVFFFSTFKTIAQGQIGVVTTFGKYRRIMLPGLNFKLPFIETIYKRISIQNRSAELEFQAITADQATVQFKALLLFAVLDQQEETIKNVAFKFVDEKNFMQTLVRTVEGSVRSFVATQKQADILGSRSEIVDHVKHQIDQTLETWGYHLIDMQMNDIAFDSAIMKSMAQVVASNNLKAAAENEGQALLITKTKQAEAEGRAIKIAALAEKEAAQLRGQGISLFREEAAKGMSEAIKQLQGSHLDASVMLFSMWTETIRHVAENGKGNVIFLDGSVDGMEHSIRQLMAMNSGNLWSGQKQ